jgi:hypothetical protein
MQPKLVLLLLVQIGLIAAFNNPICRGRRYYCENTTNANVANICVNISEFREKEHQLQACPSTKYSYCPYWTASYGSPAICSTPPAKNKTLPGATCRFDGECLSGQCISGLCKGLPENTTCVWHGECDTGLFCNTSSLCEKQRDFGQVSQYNIFVIVLEMQHVGRVHKQLCLQQANLYILLHPRQHYSCR